MAQREVEVTPTRIAVVIIIICKIRDRNGLKFKLLCEWHINKNLRIMPFLTYKLIILFTVTLYISLLQAKAMNN